MVTRILSFSHIVFKSFISFAKNVKITITSTCVCIVPLFDSVGYGSVDPDLGLLRSLSPVSLRVTIFTDLRETFEYKN